MLYCPECGAANFDDAKYCQDCGNIISYMNPDGAINNHRMNNQNNVFINKKKKFNSEMRNSGLLTLGLGIFIGLFLDMLSGLITIFFGALLLLVKKIEILTIVVAVVLLFGLYNTSIGDNYGWIQVFMALTFFLCLF